MALKITTILKHAFLPGIIPRARQLFASGFVIIPYLIALVFNAVYLLPAGHPYLNANNMGRFGLRHVLAEAANRLVISRKNIDQILVYVSVITGLIIMMVQIALVGLAICSRPAVAAMPTNFAGFFSIADEDNRAQDLANIFMDLVFGVPDIFQSCISTAGKTCVDTSGDPMQPLNLGSTDIKDLGMLPGSMSPFEPGAYDNFPFPEHLALHALFGFYDTGLLVVAMMIIIYFIITVVAETAQTGTPFGKRFNRLWGPIRLVVAIGLLIPYGSTGLNTSQYIVLYAAKYGSAFATNGWNLFNKTIGSIYLNQRLVGTPNGPEISGFLRFFHTAGVCFYIEKIKNGVHVTPYMVKGTFGLATFDPTDTNPPVMEIKSTTTYTDLLKFAAGDNKVFIRYGVFDKDKFKKEKGGVEPRCGELVFPLFDSRPTTDADPGPTLMQKFYWEMAQRAWWQDGPDATLGYTDVLLTNMQENTVRRLSPWGYDETRVLPDDKYRKGITDAYIDGYDTVKGLKDTIDQAVFEQNASTKWAGPWADTNPLYQKGWAGAGIWYNRIAEMNGVLMSAVNGIPRVNKYPMVMEHVLQEKKQHSQDISPLDAFNPQMGGEDTMQFLRPEDEKIAEVLYEAYHYWDPTDGSSARTHITGNGFIDFVNNLLGTNGLFEMRKNTDVHPLAQLAALGGGMINSAIENLGRAGVGATFASGFAFLDFKTGADAGEALTGFFLSLATVSITVGFTLYYIVPLMPFIYFFFAVSGWVKGIFEAMVGAPLWALAHLRIDGNGLSGQAALGGYFLILEIFLRPILIIFGFLASILIFSATVLILNRSFDLVTSNVGGFDIQEEQTAVQKLVDYLRGPVDEFFFTAIYAVIVYLMGLSAFKLVDQVPNNILRWMGQSVQSFGDQKEDAAEGLSSTTSVGVQQVSSSMKSGLADVVRGSRAEAAQLGAKTKSP